MAGSAERADRFGEVMHPHLRQLVEVLGGGLDAMLEDVERAVAVHREVVGRADRQVRPGGAHHRAECHLDRIVHVDLRVHGELQHELAVLALADLQERSLVGHADVVALGVHERQVRTLAGDLTTEDERRRGVGTDRAEAGAVALDDLLAELADVQRSLVQVVHGGQALVVARPSEVALDAIEHLVRRRQVAGRLQHEQAVGRRPQHVQLAVGADVVDAGVGARVRQEQQPLVESQGKAIGHGSLRGLGTTGGS